MDETTFGWVDCSIQKLTSLPLASQQPRQMNGLSRIWSSTWKCWKVERMPKPTNPVLLCETFCWKEQLGHKKVFNSQTTFPCHCLQFGLNGNTEKTNRLKTKETQSRCPFTSTKHAQNILWLWISKSQVMFILMSGINVVLPSVYGVSMCDKALFHS